MKALTIWQPWASLIIIGARPIEWRCAEPPAWARNQQVIIHAGSRRVIRAEIEDLVIDLHTGTDTNGLDRDKALALLLPILRSGEILPTNAGLGTAFLGEPQRGTASTGNDTIWGWPITDINRWSQPVPRPGEPVFWPWLDTTAPILEQELPY